MKNVETEHMDEVKRAKGVVSEMESKTFKACATNEDAAAVTAQQNALVKAKLVVKERFLNTLMMNNVMRNLAEPKEKWTSLVSQSEESLQSAKDNLKKARHAAKDQKTEMMALNTIIVDALTTYQHSIKNLNDKIQIFESKRQELELLKAEVLDGRNVGDAALSKDIQAAIEKTGTEIRNCHKELMQMNYKAMQMQLHISQTENELQLLTRNLDEDPELLDGQCLSRLQKSISDIEQLSGVTCKTVGANTIIVEFPPRPTMVHLLQHAGSESDSTRPQDDLVLKVTLTFQKNVLGYQRLSAIKSNLDSFELDDLWKDFKEKPVSCLPQIIALINHRWLSHIPLFSEIKWLQNRFAIDWIPQKNTLRLIVGKSGSTVCSLEIPPGYPKQGHVALTSIMGAPEDIALESLKPQTGSTLVDWVQLLEYRFGKP